MSAFASVEGLIPYHEYTILIADYNNCHQTGNVINNFQGTYIGWKLNGLQRLYSLRHLRRFSVLSNDVTEEASILVREALNMNLIEPENICLVFNNIHQRWLFDTQTRRFMQPQRVTQDNIDPFIVSGSETRIGTAIYETYVTLNFVLGSGDRLITNIQRERNNYLEVDFLGLMRRI